MNRFHVLAPPSAAVWGGKKDAADNRKITVFSGSNSQPPGEAKEAFAGYND